jgi:pimeloyl-ACP methyl ester carboxylesterase
VGGELTRAERCGGAERSLEWQGLRLAYEEYGSGERVIVMLHGLLLDANVNRALGARLAHAGYRVLLLDLSGHGRSTRLGHASYHRVDKYADQVVALLDDLAIEQAVVGGVSLGANVSLYAAMRAPERVRGLIIEMPCLEWATPAACALFLPLLLAYHYIPSVMRLNAAITRRLPKFGNDAFDTFRTAGGMEPEHAAAILHGLMVGPLAPSIEERGLIQQPALVIGHMSDVLHPFSDATNLSRQLPQARLVRARSPLELRLRPDRLTRVITSFAAEVWQTERRPKPAYS